MPLSDSHEKEGIKAHAAMHPHPLCGTAPNAPARPRWRVRRIMAASSPLAAAAASRLRVSPSKPTATRRPGLGVVGSGHGHRGPVVTAALFGSKAAAKTAAKPPAGTAADANLFKAAGVALAIPALPTFVATQPVLDAFHLSNSSPFAFASIADVQHFDNVFSRA